MDWKAETDPTNKTLLPSSPLYFAIISSTPSVRTGTSLKLFLDNIDKSLNKLSKSWCQSNCSDRICTQISFDLESNKYLRNTTAPRKNEEDSTEPWLYAQSGWKGIEDQFFTQSNEIKNATSYQLIYEPNTLSFKRRPYEEKLGNNKTRSQKQSRYRNNLKKPCRKYDHSMWLTADISSSSPHKSGTSVKDKSALRDRVDRQCPCDTEDNNHRKITRIKRTSSKSSFRSDNSQTISLTKINIDRKNGNNLNNNDMIIGYNSTSKLLQNQLNISSNIISKGIISMDNILARDRIQNETNFGNNLSSPINLSMDSNITPTPSTGMTTVVTGTPFIYPKNIIWNSSRKNPRQNPYPPLQQQQQQQQQIIRKHELVNDVMKRNIFTTEFDRRKKYKNPQSTKFGSNIRKDGIQHSLFSAESKHSHHFLTPLNVNSKKHF